MFKPGWINEQFDKNKEAVKEWPEYIRKELEVEGLSYKEQAALLKAELQKQLDTSGIRIKNYFGVLTCEECDRSGHDNIKHRNDYRTGSIREVLKKCE
jgi:hypothetical protein